MPDVSNQGFFSAPQPQAWQGTHVATAGTRLLCAQPAMLHSVTINQPIANGITQLYDSATTAGTTAANMIANITNFGTVLTEPPLNGIYDQKTRNGLVLVTLGTQDVSVSYLP